MATMSSGTGSFSGVGVAVGVVSFLGIVSGVWVFVAWPSPAVIFSDDSRRRRVTGVADNGEGDGDGKGEGAAMAARVSSGGIWGWIFFFVLSMKEN